MTAKEERAFGATLGDHLNCGVYIWSQPSYTVSVYIWTHLTEGTAFGVYIWTQ